LRQVPGRWREWQAQLTRRQRANLLFAIWGLLIVVFFSFSTPGVLHHPRAPRICLAAWRMVGEGSGRTSGRRRSARREDFCCVSSGNRHSCLRRWNVFSFLVEGPCSGNRSRRTAEEEPAGICALHGTFPRPDSASSSSLSRPLAGHLAGVLAGNRAELVFAATPGARQS